jgi:hypothetical protein
LFGFLKDFFSLVFGSAGVWIQGFLNLLGRYSTNWAMPPALHFFSWLPTSS